MKTKQTSGREQKHRLCRRRKTGEEQEEASEAEEEVHAAALVRPRSGSEAEEQAAVRTGSVHEAVPRLEEEEHVSILEVQRTLRSARRADARLLRSASCNALFQHAAAHDAARLEELAKASPADESAGAREAPGSGPGKLDDVI
jgi:hypothetical protein